MEDIYLCCRSLFYRRRCFIDTLRQISYTQSIKEWNSDKPRNLVLTMFDQKVDFFHHPGTFNQNELPIGIWNLNTDTGRVY
jgi:hypothetical protein